MRHGSTVCQSGVSWVEWEWGDSGVGHGTGHPLLDVAMKHQPSQSQFHHHSSHHQQITPSQVHILERWRYKAAMYAVMITSLAHLLGDTFQYHMWIYLCWCIWSDQNPVQTVSLWQHWWSQTLWLQQAVVMTTWSDGLMDVDTVFQ